MPHLGGGRLAGRRRGGAEARATEDGHEFLHRQSRQELKESKRKKDLKKKKNIKSSLNVININIKI